MNYLEYDLKGRIDALRNARDTINREIDRLSFRLYERDPAEYMQVEFKVTERVLVPIPTERETEMYFSGEKIKAIKSYRDRNKTGVAEAKTALEKKAILKGHL